MYISHFVHPFSVNVDLRRFHLAAMMNNAARNIDAPVYVRVPALSSFEYIARSGTTLSCGNLCLYF